MSNVPVNYGIRVDPWHVDLAKMMSSPKRVMQNPANQSFLVTFRLQRNMLKELVDVLDDVLRSDDDDPTFNPGHCATSAPETLCQLSNHQRFRAQKTEIVQKEGRCIYTLKMDNSFSEAAEGALPESF